MRLSMAYNHEVNASQSLNGKDHASGSGLRKEVCEEQTEIRTAEDPNCSKKHANLEDSGQLYGIHVSCTG